MTSYSIQTQELASATFPATRNNAEFLRRLYAVLQSQ
jgi:hypothetical protein